MTRIAYGVIFLAVLIPLVGFVYKGVKTEIAKEKKNKIDYPICADSAGAELTLEHPQAEVPLNPNCWSGWVSLPQQVNTWIKHLGQLELLFWDGRRIFLASPKEKKWLGQIREANFRLRGDGVAIISVEPRAK